MNKTGYLIDKIYDGSVDKLFAALLGRKKLSSEQIQKLRQIVEDFVGFEKMDERNMQGI